MEEKKTQVKKKHCKKAKEESCTAKKATNEKLRKDLLDRFNELNSKFASIKDIKRHQRNLKNYVSKIKIYILKKLLTSCCLLANWKTNWKKKIKLEI